MQENYRSTVNRVGLSEYTSQRLAELKAKRAEHEAEMRSSTSKSFYPSPSMSIDNSNIANLKNTNQFVNSHQETKLVSSSLDNTDNTDNFRERKLKDDEKNCLANNYNEVYSHANNDTSLKTDSNNYCIRQNFESLNKMDSTKNSSKTSNNDFYNSSTEAKVSTKIFSDAQFKNSPNKSPVENKLSPSSFNIYIPRQNVNAIKNVKLSANVGKPMENLNVANPGIIIKDHNPRQSSLERNSNLNNIANVSLSPNKVISNSAISNGLNSNNHSFEENAENYSTYKSKANSNTDSEKYNHVEAISDADKNNEYNEVDKYQKQSPIIKPFETKITLINSIDNQFNTNQIYYTNSNNDVLSCMQQSVVFKNNHSIDQNAFDDGTECIGFASLPDQVHRRAVKKGFDFTLMVVGESGLGKSTLISCLFQDNTLYKNRIVPSSVEMIKKTVCIEKKTMDIEERGVKLRLTIIDTPGFNDSINVSENWKTICNCVEGQFEKFYIDETGLNRKSIIDSRIHCCLFFLSPVGRGIRQVEIDLMKQLHKRVNIIPIIAKADTLTTAEIKKLKEKILDDIKRYEIEIYELPECDEDDEEFIRQDQQLKASIPFAVVGSTCIIDVGGKKVRGRMYPWGLVEVDNPLHSDFTKLRQFLIGSHMQDLKDMTQDVHYENYRARHIHTQLTRAQKERNKLKRESMYINEGTPETDILLKQKELEIEKMKKMLKQMENQLAVSKNNVKSNIIITNGLGNL